MDNFKKIFNCNCGEIHNALIDEYVVRKNAISLLPKYVEKYCAKKPFILADEKTFFVAGKKVEDILKDANICCSKYVFKDNNLKPNEETVGSAIVNFDNDCDMVIGVGSGVLNDVGKILANTAKVPYIIVATAPSMDGYASATSSMEVAGLKVSLPTKCANVIIGDIDVLKNAPEKMLVSGLGDMIAKYVSLAEWKMANVILGEYYCETIANLVKSALNKCVENAKGLLSRDEEAIKSVFEGLIIGGVAMNYAKTSRPASGVEHYFSHIWDMRGLEFGSATDFHGIQCAIGTLYAIRIYEKVREYKIEKTKAIEYVKNFNREEYFKGLKEFLGKASISMIKLDDKERKYDLTKHQKRLETIIVKWQEILEIISSMPSSKEIENLLDLIKAPKSVKEIGIDEKQLYQTFVSTKDIRDKYVLSRLCWDLGIIDEVI